MEPLVLDSSVLVDLTRGDPRATRLLASLEPDADLWSVTIVRTELLAGARGGEGPVIIQVLDELRWLDIDSMVADLAGRMAAHYRRSNPGIGLADYLVAAGTRLLDARLLTLNVRHFPMLTGLEPAYR
jgi:predicted nucleic acid-binding protein